MTPPTMARRFLMQAAEGVAPQAGLAWQNGGRFESPGSGSHDARLLAVPDPGIDVGVQHVDHQVQDCDRAAYSIVIAMITP